MDDDHVIDTGMGDIAEWSARLAAAQKEKAYRIGSVWYVRIPYGQEQRYPMPAVPCRDCVALPGDYHVPGCDVEECPRCHCQAIGCDCAEPAEDPMAGPES